MTCQVKLAELEAELTEMNANGEKLQRSYNELVEYKIVLRKVWIFFAALIKLTMLVLLVPMDIFAS